MTDEANTTENIADEQAALLADMEEKLAAAEQATLRALADLENFRRRESESRANWSRDAVAGWVTKLIPSFQELMLGAEHTSDEDVQKVIEKFMGKLGDQGLQKIEPQAGEEINPDEHAVLMAAEGEPGTVVQLLEPGWKLNDSVLIPAKISGAPLS